MTENATIIIQKDKGGAVMRQSEVKKKAEEFCEQNGIKSYPVEIVRICRENGLKVFEEYLELSYKAKQNLYSFINKKNSYLFSNKIHKEKLISEINKFNRSCQKIDEL